MADPVVLELLVFDGYSRVLAIRGAPVRLHWSLLLGLPVLAYYDWHVLLMFGPMMVVHEAGHAIAIRRAGGFVVSLDFGIAWAFCRGAGTFSAAQRAAIAFGGSIAQAILGLLVWAGATIDGHYWLAGPHQIGNFLVLNAATAIFNLLPVPPFDGATAWPALRATLRQARKIDPPPDLVDVPREDDETGPGPTIH